MIHNAYCNIVADFTVFEFADVAKTTKSTCRTKKGTLTSWMAGGIVACCSWLLVFVVKIMYYLM